MKPKIYHIVHVDRLPLILADNGLLSDAIVTEKNLGHPTIGMSRIKQRRLNELSFSMYPDLRVGQCVPFYFCPRSVMLYMIHRKNHPDLTYRDGQEPIIHLELDVEHVVAWAEEHGLRWVFTTSNAGSRYFLDYANREQFAKINWDAVNATDWKDVREEKQAEFLVETRVEWSLVERIGVYNKGMKQRTELLLSDQPHCPAVDVLPLWYY
jgi:hypothetical protein